MKFTTYLGQNLFERDEDIHVGHTYFFKLFELFILWQTIKHAFEWGYYTLKIQDVILTLGIANYVDISFMHGNQLPIYNAIAISLLCFLAFFRIGSRWTYLVAAILLHFQYVARFSIGEIPHSANLVGWSVLAFGVGFLYTTKPEERMRLSLGLIFFFLGLGYTTAFFAKLIGTGITWADGRHLWLWMAEKGTDIFSREGDFAPNALQQLAFNYIPAATVILLFGWISELFGFLFWFKKTRPIIAVFLIGLHLGITISMNIRFDAFVIQIIMLGFPWPILMKKLDELTFFRSYVLKIA
jgi:hypothetical protein